MFMSGNSDNDLDDLLEKSIDEKYSKVNDKKPGKCPFDMNFKGRPKFMNRISRSINKIEEKVKFNQLLLPEGWIRLFHESGMFFYCHVSTKVVTWSMPYQLQTEPPRYHRVPVRSIACLSFEFMKNEGQDLLKNSTVEKKSEKQTNNDQSINKSNEEICVEGTQDKLQDSDELVHVNEEVCSNGPMKLENEQKDMEDGEIKSSEEEEEEAEKDSSKNIFLPKQYQIDTVKHKPSRLKVNSMSEVRKPSAYPVVPVKRRKVMSFDDQTNEEKTQEAATTSDHQNTAETNPDATAEYEDFSCRLLEPAQLRNYCSRRFKFVEESRYVPRFIFMKKKPNKTSATSADQPANQTADVKSQALVTNSNIETKVSNICTEKLKIPNKNIYIELAGRNYSCILNMYCQNAFGVTPTFKASSSLSGIHDFEVACDISGTPYAIGEGRTKKIAKQRAVIKTLEILVPGFMNKVSECSENASVTDNVAGTSTSQPITTLDRVDGEIYSIFDNMDITDPRVLSYTTRLNSMTPYNMLIECMNRHCVLDSHLISTITKQNRHNVYKMKLGEKEVQANCENKREGRQLAAQYMLAKLHPHIQRWGGILRLYGPDSKPIKRFDMQEMQNLLLEDRGGVKSNLINLLRKKMLELNEERQSTNKTYAKFKVPFENIPIIVFHPDSKDRLK